MYVYLNGQFVDEERASVSVFDRGFLYGDGVFETMRTYDGHILWLAQHLHRLFDSAHMIMLPLTQSKQDFTDILRQVIDRNALRNGLLRVTVSRGKGPPGLDIDACHPPTVIITSRPHSPYSSTHYTHGVSLVTLDVRRNSTAALSPSIKSLNFLNNILAKAEATRKGAFDGIMLNQHSHLTEATTSNLFLAKDGQLFTPAATCGILEGITRNAVLGIATEQGIASPQQSLTVDALYAADECFLTNTSMEIMPVTQIDNHMIGSGRPGPMTLHLHDAFRRNVMQYLNGLAANEHPRGQTVNERN